MIKQRIELILVSVYKSVCNVRSVKGDLSWTAATGSRQREEKLQQQQQRWERVFSFDRRKFFLYS